MVKPPRKPVTSNRRVGSEEGLWEREVLIMPMRKLPMIFTKNVGATDGRVGESRLSPCILLAKSRKNAPANPPTAITKKLRAPFQSVTPEDKALENFFLSVKTIALKIKIRNGERRSNPAAPC